MAYPIPVTKDVEDVLTTATSEQLQMLALCVAAAAEAGELPDEAGQVIVSVLRYELQLRQVEPLWRKTVRFAKQAKNAFATWWEANGNGATKVAAGVALGLLFGISLDD